MKMDHHCPWINNCSGHFNQLYFIKFLAAAVWGCLHSVFVLSPSIYRAFFRVWYLYYGDGTEPIVNLGVYEILLCIFADGLAIGVICSVGFLLVVNLRIVQRNRTGIEDWILMKANYRRKDDPDLSPFIYPYDLGWRENAKQTFVWSNFPKGDGFSYPVVEGCDQFTLTEEQIAQKANKEAHLVEYEGVTQYGGSYFPLFAFGPKVAVCIPLTDEPRIPVRTGDRILVSRWKRHWLYGEVLQSGGVRFRGASRLRGWFPRRCVTKIREEEKSVANSGDKKTE